MLLLHLLLLLLPLSLVLFIKSSWKRFRWELFKMEPQDLRVADAGLVCVVMQRCCSAGPASGPGGTSV